MARSVGRVERGSCAGRLLARAGRLPASAGRVPGGCREGAGRVPGGCRSAAGAGRAAAGGCRSGAGRVPVGCREGAGRVGDPTGRLGLWAGVGSWLSVMRQAGVVGTDQGAENHRSGHIASAVVWASGVIAVAVLAVESIKAVERFRLRRLARNWPHPQGDRPVMRPTSHREAPPSPAGTGNTPALPLDRLDRGAWAALHWRHEHLPLGRIRSRADWFVLSSLEGRAARRVADRLNLDDDQRYSLRHHHRVEVDRRAKAFAPDHVETWEDLLAQVQTRPRGPTWVSSESRQSTMSPFDLWWERNMPQWWVGWPTWFRARRREMHEWWFWLVTLRDYRGAPPLAKVSAR
jgi:hypothetical protein